MTALICELKAVKFMKIALLGKSTFADQLQQSIVFWGAVFRHLVSHAITLWSNRVRYQSEIQNTQTRSIGDLHAKRGIQTHWSRAWFPGTSLRNCGD